MLVLKSMRIVFMISAMLLVGVTVAAVSEIKLTRQISSDELMAAPSNITIRLYESQQGGTPVLQQEFYAGDWKTNIDLSEGLPANQQAVQFELLIAASEATKPIEPGQILWADFALDGKSSTARFAVQAPTEPKFTILGDIVIADPSRGIYFGDSTYQDTASPLVSNGAATQSLNMGSHKITNLTTPTAGTDAATKAYVDAKPGDNLGSHQAGQNLNMQNHKITSLATPAVSMDAVTKAYVDKKFAELALLMTGGAAGLQGSGLLNDTGITTCSSMTVNGYSCPQAAFLWQDGDDGRDEDASTNTNTDGHAGFSFTKLDANGNDLPANAASWQCVRDNVTDLIWEVKTDDNGLHDKDHSYTWYLPDPAPNGGSPGTADGGICTGSNCDTYSYALAVNQQGLCGANDWRLPAWAELVGIADFSGGAVAIDAGYFPNTYASYYWLASPYAYNASYAWNVYFYNGNSHDSNKSNGRYVRLVRGGQ